MKLDPLFNLEEQENKYDLKGLWAGISIRQIAEEVSKDLKFEYYKQQYERAYVKCADYVHANPVTICDYLSKDENENVKMNYSLDENDAYGIGIQACDVVLDLMYNPDEKFNSSKKALIDNLNKKSFEVFKDFV